MSKFYLYIFLYKRIFLFSRKKKEYQNEVAIQLCFAILN